jgi:hypothetical protein
MTHVSLCVYTFGLEVSLLREVGSVPPMMATDQNHEPSNLEFHRKNLGPVKLLWIIMVDYLEYRLAIGRMVVVLVWNLVTASVIIAINLTLPIALLKFTVTLLMSNNSVLLMEKVLPRFDSMRGYASLPQLI